MIITIDLLSGRYVATAYNDRDAAEWPPHPGRLFSALVATWAEGDPRSLSGEAELAALHWLERQPAPEIRASALDRAGLRDVVTVFVPVNDVAVVSPPNREKLEEAEAALASATDPKEHARLEKALRKVSDKYSADVARAVDAPAKLSEPDAKRADDFVNDRRNRQPRTFPCATPESSLIAFVWTDLEPPAETATALGRLLSRLVRLGHSSSLVAASLASAARLESLSPNLQVFTPDEDDGDLSIRWVSEGQAAELIRAYDAHRELEPRVHPARFVRYRQDDRMSSPALVRSLFGDDMIVLARTPRSGNPRLPITSTVGVTRQLRRALMSCADEPIHEALSGHRPDGTASETPHLAIIPLPVVSGPHPDGVILGFGLMMPRELDSAARQAILRALGRLEQQGRRDDASIVLHLGDAGDLELERVVWGEDRRAALRPSTWSRSSARWGSVTPVALDRNPGDLDHHDPGRRHAAFAAATATVAEAVQRVGLPAPIEIDVVRSCVLPGTAKPRAFPRFPIGVHRSQRVLVHVRLQFAEGVRGPIAIGAGRYQGLGLLAPTDNAPVEHR